MEELQLINGFCIIITLSVYAVQHKADLSSATAQYNKTLLLTMALNDLDFVKINWKR